MALPKINGDGDPIGVDLPTIEQIMNKINEIIDKVNELEQEKHPF